MRVAIHQPNFMPWLGLYHRLAMVDRYVVFDHVQAMGGRSWLSRNRVLLNGAPHWLTVPVLKSGRFGQSVRDVEIDHSGNIGAKHLRSLKISYGKAAHAGPFLELMHEIHEARHRTIAEFNLHFTRHVCRELGMAVEFVFSSDLVRDNPWLENAAGNDLVLGLCQAAEATSYVSGEGCLDFIKPESFEERGIAFYFQKFSHPVYPQKGTGSFVSHLSIFDALCNIGTQGVRSLLASPGLERPYGPGSGHG